MLARFISTLFRPRHVIIADELAATTSQHRMIRPITPVFIVLLSIVLGVGVGLLLPQKLAENGIESPFVIPPQQHEEQQNDKLELAELEAENAIKVHQIDELKKLLQQQQQQLATTKAELHQLNGILNLRKEKGVHILDVSLTREAEKQLTFSAILVKGGSYPRHIKGKIKFLMMDSQGKPITLTFQDGKQALPFYIETHTFMHGVLLQPEQSIESPKVIAVLTDSRGKEISRKICTQKKEVSL